MSLRINYTQLLPCFPCKQDDEDQENGIDYSSLSGLMSALATHGTNTIPVNEDEEAEATGTQEEGDRKRDNISPGAEEVSKRLLNKT